MPGDRQKDNADATFYPAVRRPVLVLQDDDGITRRYGAAREPKKSDKAEGTEKRRDGDRR